MGLDLYLRVGDCCWQYLATSPFPPLYCLARPSPWWDKEENDARKTVVVGTRSNWGNELATAKYISILLSVYVLFSVDFATPPFTISLDY